MSSRLWSRTTWPALHASTRVDADGLSHGMESAASKRSVVDPLERIALEDGRMLRPLGTISRQEPSRRASVSTSLSATRQQRVTHYCGGQRWIGTRWKETGSSSKAR